MSIGGVVSKIKIALQSDVLFVSSWDNVNAAVQLKPGAEWDDVKLVEGTASFSEPKTETPSGIVYNPRILGTITPVSPENEARIQKYIHTRFVAWITLKNGGSLIVGDKYYSCKIINPADVSPDHTKNGYAIEIACKSTHPAFFL